jgi:hypothetical protein
MFRNAFGEPKPKGKNEIIDALDEYALNPRECSAVLNYNEDDGVYTGWTATIDGESIQIDTLGYQSKNDLLNNLKSVGIVSIMENE